MIGNRLRNIRKEYDLIIVGGGIHGATLLWEAVSRGLSAILVEKGDFCGATSANSLKILHGGLRYLQHLNIKRMRQSILARKAMMHFAPSLMIPLPCLMPAYGYGLRGREVLNAAIFINDIISFDRNFGLPSEIKLKNGFTISKKKCLKIIPGISEKKLKGAAIWHDTIAINTERLVLKYILQSVNFAGATATNYTEAKSINRQPDGIFEIQITDILTNHNFYIKAKTVVNASGPWIGELFPETYDINKNKQQWAMALNLITKKQFFGKYAVGLEGTSKYQDKDAVLKKGKRLFFFVPWKNYTMIGTNYKPHAGSPSKFVVERNDIENMLAEINTIYPAAKLKYKDITFYHAGLLPMKEYLADGNIQLEKNSQIIQHSQKELSGVISIKGVKYTTAAYIAKKVAACIEGSSRPFFGTGKQNYLLKQTTFTPEHSLNSNLTRKDIIFFIREEMAVKLSDIIFRRTDFGTAECPPLDSLKRVSSVMAEVLDWDIKREKQELNEVLYRYQPLINVASL